MNSITTKSIFVLFVGLAALLVFVIVSPVGATGAWIQVYTDTTLTEDYYGHIAIMADNVTLDCDGNAVIGDGTSIGIYMAGRTHVTVKNCEVSGFDYGIVLHSSFGNSLLGNVVNHNHEEGIRIQREITIPGLADNNLIAGNTANGNGKYGIVLDNASHNTLERNTANLNQWHGFGVFLGSLENRLVSNTANNNVLLGFNLGVSPASLLQGNQANNNGGCGYGLHGTNQSQLVRNVANHNGNCGFFLFESSHNYLEANVAYNNSFAGFDVSSASEANYFHSNSAKHNDVFGFTVYLASDNTLASNSGCHNTQQDAVDHYDGYVNTWVDNDFCSFYIAN